MSDVSKEPIKPKPIEYVPLRDVWEREDSLTRLLADSGPDGGSRFLGKVLGMDLELIDTERPLGCKEDLRAIRADILFRDKRTSRYVIVENQLDGADQKHMGQLLDYMGGVEEEFNTREIDGILIASHFKPVTERTIRFLNKQKTRTRIWAVEIKATSDGRYDLRVIVKPELDDSVDNGSKALDAIPKLSKSEQRNERYGHKLNEALEKENENSTLPAHQKVTPRPKVQTTPYQNFSTGHSGFEFSAGKNNEERLYCAVCTNYSNSEWNFDQLKAQRKDIESQLADFDLHWDEKDSRMAREVVAYYKGPVDFENEANWPEYTKWHAQTLVEFNKVLRPILNKLKRLPKN